MTQEEQVTAWLQVMQETESITDNERILIARATARAARGDRYTRRGRHLFVW